MNDDFKKHKRQLLSLLRKNGALRAYVIKLTASKRITVSAFFEKRNHYGWIIEAFGWGCNLSGDILNKKFHSFEFWQDIDRQWNEILRNNK
jgi:hypothetical protein